MPAFNRSSFVNVKNPINHLVMPWAVRITPEKGPGRFISDLYLPAKLSILPPCLSRIVLCGGHLRRDAHLKD